MAQDKNTMRAVFVSSGAPPRRVEYAYYAVLFYAIMSAAWGLSVPLLAAGAMGLLAIYCVWRLKRNGVSVWGLIALPLGCAVCFMAIQIAVHDIRFMDPSNRQFVTWILTLIVVQSLSLRQRFLHRFSLVALAIGACLLPYINVDYTGNAAVERAGLESGVAFANPNDLAAWFGFLSVYFIVLAIESKRNIVRIPCFFATGGCLFVVALTVSRGAVVAIGIAVIVALRRILKRGFFPVLFLAGLASVILLSGLFEQSIGFYTERGTEETGRLRVWPLVIERIVASPLIGVGSDDADTYVPESGRGITPHNSFLAIGLVAGIVPLAFFIAYWFKAMKGAYHLTRQGLQDAPFQLPLIIYTFLIASLTAGAFMFPWAIVTLSMAMSAGVPRRVRRLIMRRSERGRIAARETRYSTVGYQIRGRPPGA